MARDASAKLTRSQMSSVINNSPLIDHATFAEDRKKRKEEFKGLVTKSAATAESMAEKMTRAYEESIIYGARYQISHREYTQSIESQMPSAEIEAFLQIYRNNQCGPNNDRSTVNANVLTAGFIAAACEGDCLPTLAAGLIRPLTQAQQQEIISVNMYEHGYPDMEGHMIEEFVAEFETMALSAVAMLRSRAGEYRSLRTTALYEEMYSTAKAIKDSAPDCMSPTRANPTLMAGSSPYSTTRTVLPPRNSTNVTAQVPYIEELSDGETEIDGDLI